MNGLIRIRWFGLLVLLVNTKVKQGKRKRMIHIKYCRVCRKAFDIGINSDLCPECRILKRGEKDGSNRGRISKYRKL